MDWEAALGPIIFLDKQNILISIMLQGHENIANISDRPDSNFIIVIIYLL